MSKAPILKEITSTDQFIDLMKKYKASPEEQMKDMPNTKALLEVFIRKCISTLKGEKLLTFLKVVDTQLPW